MEDLQYHYTFLVTSRLGLEASIGYAGVNFGLLASKDSLSKLLIDSGITDITVATDSYIRAKIFFIPATLSLKLYGKTRTAFNAFNVGITAFMYDIETKNGITGITTKQSIAEPAIYLSYEFGWKVELFPTKSWRVKPTLDISLIEIGYYVRPWAPNLYVSLANNFAAFGAGFDLGTLIPSWNSLPSFIKPLANIRFVLFPRIGFSLRF